MRHILVRRFVAALALAMGVLLAFAPSASAGSDSLDAQFRIFFGKSTAHRCSSPEIFLCGVGTVEGYGSATTTIIVSDSGGFDAATGCFVLTFQEDIVLADGSGTLTLQETGSLCYPTAAAGSARGAVSGRSFGNPTSGTLTYTVSGGSGVFAGASGTGTVEFFAAGEVGTKTVSGSI